MKGGRQGAGALAMVGREPVVHGGLSSTSLGPQIALLMGILDLDLADADLLGVMVTGSWLREGVEPDPRSDIDIIFVVAEASHEIRGNRRIGGRVFDYKIMTPQTVRDHVRRENGLLRVISAMFDQGQVLHSRDRTMESLCAEARRNVQRQVRPLESDSRDLAVLLRNNRDDILDQRAKGDLVSAYFLATKVLETCETVLLRAHNHTTPRRKDRLAVIADLDSWFHTLMLEAVSEPNLEARIDASCRLIAHALDLLDVDMPDDWYLARQARGRGKRWYLGDRAPSPRKAGLIGPTRKK